MARWEETYPDERNATWHPEDAWIQVEGFMRAFLLGYSEGAR